MSSLKKASLEALLAEIASRLPGSVNGHALTAASLHFGPSVTEPYLWLHFAARDGWAPCGGAPCTPSRPLSTFLENASWILVDQTQKTNAVSGVAARKFLNLPV